MYIRRFCKIKMVVIISVPLLFSWKTSCFAGENDYQDAVKNVPKGGLADTAVGAAVIAFTRRTGEQPDYLSINTNDRVGVRNPLVSAFDIINKPLATIEKGKVTFGIPMIIPDFRDKTVRGTALVISTEIIRGEF
jgi:hypothetical protein